MKAPLTLAALLFAPAACALEATLFVSWSMPQPSLLAAARECAALGIPMAVRGFPRKEGETLREAFARFVPLARLGATIKIDPAAFQAEGIVSVPVLVLREGAERLAVAGDVTPRYALARMALGSSALAQAARRLLQ